MVCIAAFIILSLISVFVAFLSIFRRDIGRRYWATFKKAWGCVGKRITLQKCETGFKEDVKNSILSKVVVKKPHLVKPLSISIEVISVLIVLVTAWSLVEGAKAGLALYSLGTCNVKHAESCSLSAEVCSIDDNSEASNIFESIGLWFSDWGEIFGAIPDKFRDFSVSNFELSGITAAGENIVKNTTFDGADIFDPGCLICASSFKQQYGSGFFDEHNILLVPFPIQDNNGNFKFANSELITRYVLASPENGFEILRRIFMTQDESLKSYQTLFNNVYSAAEAEQVLQDWLAGLGLSAEEISAVAERAHSKEISEIIAKNNQIVTEEIHVKGIPTTLFGGKKHTGAFSL